MKQNEINSLLQSFFILDDDLNKREAFEEFAYSLSDIVIDEFAKNYLLNNPHLSIYLAHTDGAMLLKKMKDFFAFILRAPVDEEYIRRIEFIGSIHYSIQLEPAKVSYGFWAINEVINKMALVNEIVKEYRVLLSKLLRFVEYVMNKAYYTQKTDDKSRNVVHSYNYQNELYIGFNVHRANMEKMALAVESFDIEKLQSIEENASNCTLGKVISELLSDKKYEHILGIDIEKIHEIHNEWHKEFRIIKNAIATKDKESITLHFNNLNILTKELKEILNSTIQDSLKDGQFALSSGMKVMKNMTNLFYAKTLKELESDNLEESLKKTIQDTILSDLSWAIEDIALSSQNEFIAGYTTLKQMRYKSQNIFIAIKLKDEKSSGYLIEMISLLLQVLNLHLSVKEREVSLIEFAEKAESANKSKDMFLANMSHELRTPLNAITGFSQILMMKKDTPDGVKKYVEKINIAGNNLLDLVNTILDFAKLESGKMQFSPSLSNISDVLNEVKTLISPLAYKKNIALKMPNIISLNLFIDKTLFKQVLINLLTNAVKFTHEGGEVSLSILYNADKHRYIFEVKDNGVGLSEANISKLFQAFSQVENSYQKEQQGTGLGLMISKKIVEDLHKGKIWVESKENEGSSFFISMPTPMVESHTYTIKEAPKDALNVLIVEDSESYQKILIEHLKKIHNLTLTDTINKAKELLTKNHFNFVILDFFLTDGISSEILQYMEEEKIEIPTIVISAEDEIIISTSLAGSSNLECIVNKKNIDEICQALQGPTCNVDNEL